MTEKCPFCNSPCTIASSHGGRGTTHWYVPLSRRVIDAAKELITCGWIRGKNAATLINELKEAVEEWEKQNNEEQG
jgi:hypothetical protein